MSSIDLYEAMRTTRAVRRHRPDPIPDDVLARILEAATWAPTGGNVQPWRIVVVKDPGTREQLRDLYLPLWRSYAASLPAARGDIDDAAQRRTERMMAAATYLAEHLERSPVLLVVCFDPRRLAVTDAGQDRVPVVGGGSIYPAVQNLLLACRAENVGAVLTTLLCQHEPEVKHILGIPDPWATCACIPLGYPERGGHGPLRRRSIEQMVYAERWGEPLSLA